MALPNRPYAYSKIQYEDPDEIQHRKAQFLIYKALQKADHTRRRPLWLRVKVFKLKIKIGKRLKKLKKRLSSSVFLAKADFCKQITCVLKSCKYLLHGKQGLMIRTTPPVF
ncbi:hypothetical protein BUALT_Bualt18G0101200 [Buddleja alternifolia]|uniref:Uncharacterized protein n=1 Tax=Buddleja alternifolia TaxID=168488 RepID=A0AAV6W5L8_9LAMI|nr:hypothetical protein BUALT_Bualt18G0101200 [Buddleja alternifolia]